MSSNKKQRPNILAIDLGYSSIKYSYINENGALINDKMISAIAKLPEAPLEVDNDTVFRLGTDWYILGPNALKTARSYQMPLETFDDLLKVYPVWLSYMLKKFQNITWDKVAIGLSMAFSDRADELLKYLYETLMIDPGTEYFVCLPQGLSSRVCFSKYGENVRNNSSHVTDTKLDSFVLVDGGYLSIDICAVIDSKSAAGATIGIPDTGVICISRDIADYIYKTFEYRISIKEAQTVVDSGRLIRRGREVDLSEIVDQYTRKYLINVLNLLENKYSEFLDAVNGLLIVGGLSHYFSKYMNDEDFCKEIEKHFPLDFIHVPREDGEFYNSISYLLISENLVNKD